MNKRLILIPLMGIILTLGVVVYTSLRKIEVKFVYNNDSTISSVTEKFEKNSKVSLPNIEKEGYVLKGWFHDDEQVTDNVVYSSDTVLEARWLKVCKVKYVYEENEEEEKIIENNTVNLPKVEKEGYIINWYDESDNLVDNKTKVTKDMVITAKYKKIEVEEVKEEKEDKDV